MLTAGQECFPPIEISGDIKIKAVTFTADGEYIVGGGDEARVWQVEEGKQMPVATMAERDVFCLVVSKDGRWIAAGTNKGDAIVWDAKTFEKVFSHRPEPYAITGLDLLPDPTRLLVASMNRTATVFDIASRTKVLTLDHDGWVRAAKCSPQGDRIATATEKYVRVWDSNDGRLLMDIPVGVTTLYNTGLLWSNNHLFVVSGSTIKQLEASTGSVVREWPVPNPIFTTVQPCIALPRHGKFIAYSAKDTVTFWDTSTHAQLGLIRHPQSIRSIALSPDDRFLAIGANSKKIVIKDLRDVLPASYSTVSIVYYDISEWFLLPIHLTFQFRFDMQTDRSVSATIRSYHSCYTRFLEAGPACRRGDVIDASNHQFPEPETSRARQQSSRTSASGTLGIGDGRCRKRQSSFALTHAYVHLKLLQVHQD